MRVSYFAEPNSANLVLWNPPPVWGGQNPPPVGGFPAINLLFHTSPHTCVLIHASLHMCPYICLLICLRVQAQTCRRAMTALISGEQRMSCDKE